jgi:hypothetical protein
VVQRSFSSRPRTECQGTQSGRGVTHDVACDEGESPVGTLISGQPLACPIVPQGDGGEGGGLRLRRHPGPGTEPTVPPGGGKACRGSREQAGAHARIIGEAGPVLDHPPRGERGLLGGRADTVGEDEERSSQVGQTPRRE